MKSKFSKPELIKAGKAAVFIAIGTLSGILTYQFFLYFNIAIFGWNLGLLFAPLVAGYVETYLALKFLHESIGAISAFILFIVTVIYGFILFNPTLGFNVITVGSALVILQAALPTLINYILIVVILGIISYFLGFFKKITDATYYKLKKAYYHKILKKPVPVKISKKTFYNENKNCLLINKRGFYFYTTTHPLKGEVKQYFGPFVGSSAFEKRAKMVSSNFEKEDQDLLRRFKIAQYDALNNLADNIEKAGGNGVLNLKIEFELVDMAKGRFQVIAHGTAVLIK
ncbi:MAG: heavy metal-binding domain-containing protein [Methanobrevibacter sp.]|uniref:heavy metal-binding domain-containing protein n=1 Tax=Methanobrevibacter sp. TaxID=66852 RepID=UPI0026DFD6F2|nr:heavy metal-binding domain-containing protein [Methanobrevibacter sp.]MDO5848891.1 heavy metal-binding domain-containing protein [Methanobrevibacter sp.]